MLNTCLFWELLMLPSDACAPPNLPSLRTPDGDTNNEPCEFLPLWNADMLGIYCANQKQTQLLRTRTRSLPSLFLHSWKEQEMGNEWRETAMGQIICRHRARCPTSLSILCFSIVSPPTGMFGSRLLVNQGMFRHLFGLISGILNPPQHNEMKQSQDCKVA